MAEARPSGRCATSAFLPAATAKGNIPKMTDDTERTCGNCGRSIEGKSPRAIYCSNRCKSAAGMRRRYRANPEKARAAKRARYARAKARAAQEAPAIPQRALTLWQRLRAAILALLPGAAK